MNKIALYFALFIFLLTFSRVATTDEADDFVQQEMQRQQIPGLALLVIHHGQIVKSKGYGMANLEHQVPVKPETIFQSGSVGKQFTATAVMMLVEDGKISLQDPIAKYLKVPDQWKGITIRHMLSHTTGLGDYPEDFDLRKDYTEEELLQMVTKQPLLFQPGENWNYSNLAYITLGILIRKVSGKFYGDFLQERIFHPIAMNNTRIINESDIIPNRAAGYLLVKNEIKNQEWVSPALNTTADGALYLNILDLAKWDAVLYTEELLKQSSLDQMWTPIKLNDGTTFPYGFGWSVNQHNGHRRVEHAGGWQGFATHIARYVDDRLTVAVLTNLATADPIYIAHGVAGYYAPALALAKHTQIQIDPELLHLYAGKYAYAAGSTAEVLAGENKLILKTGETQHEFRPKSNDTFFREHSETLLRFETDASGNVTYLVIEMGDLPIKLKRLS
jgi:CubicO group peptidase (beta-lactamase class C family)